VTDVLSSAEARRAALAAQGFTGRRPAGGGRRRRGLRRWAAPAGGRAAPGV